MGNKVEATGPSLFGCAFNAIKSPFTASKMVCFDNSDDDDEFQDADDGADLDAALEVEVPDESLVEEDPTPVVTRTTRSRAAKMNAGVARLSPRLVSPSPRPRSVLGQSNSKSRKNISRSTLDGKKDAEVEACAQNNIFCADELLVEIAELEEQYNDFLEQHNDLLE